MEFQAVGPRAGRRAETHPFAVLPIASKGAVKRRKKLSVTGRPICGDLLLKTFRCIHAIFAMDPFRKFFEHGVRDFSVRSHRPPIGRLSVSSLIRSDGSFCPDRKQFRKWATA